MSAVAESLGGFGRSFDDQQKDALRGALPWLVRVKLAGPGFVPDIAKTVPEDWPMLFGVFYQLIGIWVLQLAIQAIAATTLSGDVRIGLAFGLLSATLILLCDRSIIIADCLREGEYWYLADKNPQHPRIAALRWKRWGGMVLRYAFGIVLSIAAVTIAAPALLKYEIDAIIRRDERSLNAGLEAEIAAAREGKRLLWEEKTASALLATQGVGAAEAQLVTLRAKLETSDVRDAPMHADLQSKILILRERADFAQGCAQAEEYGVANPACDAVVPASGRPECKTKCTYWLAEAATLRSNADRAEQDLAALRAEALGRVQQGNAETTALIEAQLAEIHRLEAVRDEALQAEQAAQEAWQNNDAAFGEALRGSRSYQVLERAGIVRVYDAHGVVMSEASLSTHRMLNWVKAFLIFLETLCFTTRLFGSSRSYSKAVFERYLKRWNLVVA